jgi:hypothetical protein
VEFVTTKFNRKECGRFVLRADDSKDNGDGVSRFVSLFVRNFGAVVY